MAEQRLWIVVEREDAGAVFSWPEDAGSQVEVLASDDTWTLCRGSLGEMERAYESIAPYVRIFHPRAGRYIDAGGAEVYVDDNCQVVESTDYSGGQAVLLSLGYSIEQIDALDSADEELERLDRTW